MSEYMDNLFDRAVEKYKKNYEENPILARNALMGYLGADEVDGSCVLCTRECPVRNDSIINCEFNNSNSVDSDWYIGDWKR